MLEQPSDLGSDRRFFLILIAFRWASLFPALWLLITPGDGLQAGTSLPALPALLAAVVITLLISIFFRPLNRWLVDRPLLLLVDMVFCTGLLAVSGGAHSPYFLFALSPLLAGAFFFQIRGALIFSAIFTLLYLVSLAVAPARLPNPTDATLLFSQLAGIWLIPVMFSYPALLLTRINETRRALAAARDDLEQQNADLARANRQLEIIHDLTVLLQAAPDLHTVQQRVLQAVTNELGFPQAIVGLMNPDTHLLGDWHSYPANGNGSTAGGLGTPYASPIAAILESGASAYLSAEEIGLGNASRRWLGIGLNLREHPVGILLVALNEAQQVLSSSQQDMLQVVASQAAVALGTTMVCIDRTRRLAVEQERNRIARDIHDTIAQSMFGMVFSLDACISLLPEQVETVKHELDDLRALASRVRDEVRQSIFDLWPGELTLERFKADLSAYVSQCCQPHSFQVNFTTSGDFDRLSPLIRRTLFRITQEALMNAARHSGARSARVCLGIEADQVHLSVGDQGCGFDIQSLGMRSRTEGGFGLSGITARVNALGGSGAVFSQPDQGTLILVSLPIAGNGTVEL